ncbi:Scr1 family TA system antitoxin-like transcriptional regulator [Glycomyces paridis]|uniref:DUF5753 domain-containing protein n=1 Tax=Glycomyces paridis TaxID=2126555 RepID=A0A4S8PFS8_9ACTN|nr:Scr1 family TA system antitoxin-like transcriptional regulator [Glycomyces paridis]THV28721.1 hypothetical protein E9998_11490 [Glycomyces paridis]
MAGTILYERFVKAYLKAEVRIIAEEAGWTPAIFGDVMCKSTTTIKAWLGNERLPDLGNMSLICDRGRVDPDRKQFIMHVREQLLTGSEMVSNLEERAMYIVEASERNYGTLVKWDPVLLSALVQTEAFHMEALPEAREGTAHKIPNWKRKEKRQEAFFNRIGSKSSPVTELYIPSNIFTVIDNLAAKDKSAQIARLVEVDAMPGCEVRVVRTPMVVPSSFESFKGDGFAGAGPDFVYVETYDQSRHVVEPANVALYDQARSRLRADSQEIGRWLDGGVHQLAEEHAE